MYRISMLSIAIAMITPIIIKAQPLQSKSNASNTDIHEHPSLLIISDNAEQAYDCEAKLKEWSVKNDKKAFVIKTHLLETDSKLKKTPNHECGAEQIYNIPINAEAVLIQLGSNDIPDNKTQEENYEHSLFNFPTGHICTMTGRMHRKGRLAISKKNVSNNDFAGALYNIVKYIREKNQDARIFIQQVPQKTEADTHISRQISTVARMMCIPVVQSDMQTLCDYYFIWDKNSRPKLGKILLLGDSYCEQRRWTDQMERIADVQLTNLGVGSMTVKDKYDWKTSPYSSRPIKTDNQGNHNTISSQIEKLKRLMKGTELYDGETALGTNYQPDIILLEGGANDMPDLIDSIKKDSSQYALAIAEDNRTTFAGAMAHAVKEMRSMFPNTQIYFITTSGLYYGHTDKPFDFMKKSDQLRMAASLLNIQTIDWDCEGRLSFVFNNSESTGDGSQKRPYRYDCPTRETRDLLHPNETGGLYLAEAVVKKLVKDILQQTNNIKP